MAISAVGNALKINSVNLIITNVNAVKLFIKKRPR
jgi:hypothetical protein